MARGVGIDFGTTNSVAALYDGERVDLVLLENGEAVMPSATYIDVELQTATGQAAIDRYIADNTSRKVELVSEVVGGATLLVGDADPEHRRPVETMAQRVYGQAVKDCGLQGRLFATTGAGGRCRLQGGARQDAADNGGASQARPGLVRRDD